MVKQPLARGSKTRTGTRPLPLLAILAKWITRARSVPGEDSPVVCWKKPSQ